MKGTTQNKNIKNRRETQDPEIRIEALEPDPTRRGYTQIPNYFKYYWTPLIGHKAAAVYEMILSFAHGDKDICNPSLNRLCAHLGMTQNELTGRRRRIRVRDRRIKEYREKGMLEILQEYGLLVIEASGDNPYTRSYTFGILKSPPLLTPQQFSRLPAIVQKSHQELMKRCENDRDRLKNQTYFEGYDSVRGGDMTVSEGGYDNAKSLREKNSPQPKQNQAIPGTKVFGTKQLKEQIKNNNNDTSPHISENVPFKSSVVVVCDHQKTIQEVPQNHLPFTQILNTSADTEPSPVQCNSFLTVYENKITCELVPQFGTELVQRYIDWLEFQYRDNPPKKPFTLLAVSLTRGNLIQPEGFEDREELERKRLEKERQRETARKEEEGKKQEAEANQEKLAQAQALYESLPEGEKEVWWQKAIRELPVFLRSMSSIVENQILMLILKELKPGGRDFPERTGEETT